MHHLHKSKYFFFVVAICGHAHVRKSRMWTCAHPQIADLDDSKCCCQVVASKSRYPYDYVSAGVDLISGTNISGALEKGVPAPCPFDVCNDATTFCNFAFPRSQIYA